MSTGLNQSTYLSILTRSPAVLVKAFAEQLIPILGSIDVIQNRTGLVMIPITDTVQGGAFYLGEALIAEAHVRIGTSPHATEGYAACLGRDLEQALAIALIDAAACAGVAQEQIAAFVREQGLALEEADRLLVEQVETTRVEMETF